MRLKSLRKQRPTFEIEGAVINGNRMDLSKSDIKSKKYRSNTSFALPTSLDSEPSPLVISSSHKIHEMSVRSRREIVIPTASQPSNLASYQAVEAAYLEHGIRIRLSPTRARQQSGKKSENSLQRRAAFLSRNPIRTSSVLHYSTTNLDQQHDSRPFSALQQTSSNDFVQEHTHNVSYAQSSQINEETHDDFLSGSIIASEHSNPMTLPEKLHITTDIISTTTTLFHNDPDFIYMSELLTKSNGDSFRDTIRRRAGLRGTFSTYRHPLTVSSIQPQQQFREKPPNINRHSLTSTTTIAVLPTSSANKIDKEILRHASRIRSKSQSKDYSMKSSRIDSMPIDTPSPRNDHSINKPLKSMSLEPLKFLLSPTSPSASSSIHDLPSVKISANSHHRKTSSKRTKLAKISNVEKPNITNSLSKEYLNSPTVSRNETLPLMKTSSLDMAPQSNSFDSGCYDHSSSSVDGQSLASSSVMQLPSSIPSARLTNSSARRSNTNKRVSFYEEPTPVILTTTTYV